MTSSKIIISNVSQSIAGARIDVHVYIIPFPRVTIKIILNHNINNIYIQLHAIIIIYILPFTPPSADLPFRLELMLTANNSNAENKCSQPIGEKVGGGRNWFSYGALIVNVLMTAALPIFTSLTKRRGQPYNFNPHSVVLFSELIKFLISVLFFLR